MRWCAALGAFLIMLNCFLLTGCDPVNRHKILTTIFDGVPKLPEPEQLCEEYYQQRIQEEKQRAEMAAEAKSAGSARSIHKPYGEKRCNDCHDFSSTVGLIRPKEQLCIGCHTDFIKGRYVHGPIATGNCSACHLPHMSEHPYLLELPKSEICAKCHKEKRLAEAMHHKVMERGMECVDCHDPHYGDARYFLR